jgi:hypothetical protein
VHWAGDDLLVTPVLSSGMMIRQLYVEKNHFLNVKDFISLLLAFPQLRRMEIDWSYAVGDGTSWDNSQDSSDAKFASVQDCGGFGAALVALSVALLELWYTQYLHSTCQKLGHS